MASCSSSYDPLAPGPTLVLVEFDQPKRRRCAVPAVGLVGGTKIHARMKRCGCVFPLTVPGDPTIVRKESIVFNPNTGRKHGCARCVGMELRTPEQDGVELELDDMDLRREQLAAAGYRRHTPIQPHLCFHDNLVPHDTWIKRHEEKETGRVKYQFYYLCPRCTVEETAADPNAVQAPPDHTGSEEVPPGFTSLPAFERHLVQHSRWWFTPLHCLAPPAVISPEKKTGLDPSQVRNFLRGDTVHNDIHAAAGPLCPSPLTYAWELRAAGSAPAGSGPDLVLRAAEPWSPRNHELFPGRARARAVFLMCVGYRLTRGNNARWAPLLDVWIAHVMRYAVSRGCGRERHTPPTP